MSCVCGYSWGRSLRPVRVRFVQSGDLGIYKWLQALCNGVSWTAKRVWGKCSSKRRSWRMSDAPRCTAARLARACFTAPREQPSGKKSLHVRRAKTREVEGEWALESSQRHAWQQLAGAYRSSSIATAPAQAAQLALSKWWERDQTSSERDQNGSHDWRPSKNTDQKRSTPIKRSKTSRAYT